MPVSKVAKPYQWHKTPEGGSSCWFCSSADTAGALFGALAVQLSMSIIRIYSPVSRGSSTVGATIPDKCFVSAGNAIPDFAFAFQLSTHDAERSATHAGIRGTAHPVLVQVLPAVGAGGFSPYRSRHYLPRRCPACRRSIRIRDNRRSRRIQQVHAWFPLRIV